MNYEMKCEQMRKITVYELLEARLDAFSKKVEPRDNVDESIALVISITLTINYLVLEMRCLATLYKV